MNKGKKMKKMTSFEKDTSEYANWYASTAIIIKRKYFSYRESPLFRDHSPEQKNPSVTQATFDLFGVIEGLGMGMS